MPTRARLAGGFPLCVLHCARNASASCAPRRRLNVEDSALLAVYQRLATVEEALAGCNAQAAGLHSKVDEATRKVTATSLQVEAEVPALKDQLSELRNSLAKVKSGHTDSAYAEAAVRRLVNKSVLPEVIERQVRPRSREPHQARARCGITS